MKFFFLFFLLCLPLSSAIAVTPTSITLSEESGAKVYVYNTEEHMMQYQVYGVYAENFSLEAHETKMISLPAQGGLGKGSLHIEEVYPEGFVNAVSLPVYYSSLGFPQKRDGFSPFFFALSLFPVGIAVLGCVYYMFKKKRVSKRFK